MIASGMKIYVSEDLPRKFRREQFRFPKSKRRRIRKKWRKASKNWRSVELASYMTVGGVTYANRIGFEVLKRLVKEIPF